jgi:hypothetical protein
MGCGLLCYRTLFQMCHHLHLLARDLLEGRSDWSNNASPNQLQGIQRELFFQMLISACNWFFITQKLAIGVLLENISVR